MQVSIAAVISKYNIHHIPYILDIAKRYKVGVHFQPVDQSLSANSQKDIRLLFGPNENDYKKAITFLIRKKSNGYKFIESSLDGLKHLYHWPHPRKISCLASLLSCVIEPDGKIFICDMFPAYQKYLVPISESFKKSFNSLSLPYHCQGCWSGLTVEFNLLRSFKLRAAIGIWNILRLSLIHI